jgi:FtsP/CotA-like multicopper oxidase with cupredoxin domain
MRIAPGETQLWHLANIASDVFYRLTLDGTKFTVLAEDANLLDRPRRAGTLLLPPGKRFDVLVTGGPPGVTRLRTLVHHQGVALFPERTLAMLRSAGAQRRPPKPPKQLRGFHRLDHARIAQRRRFTFDESGDGADFHFRIDGEVFDPNRVDVRAKLGTVEEWRLVNTTTATSSATRTAG